MIAASLMNVSAQSLRHYFDDTETRYLGFALSGQFWARHTALNPGSVIKESQQTEAWDLSVRRYRMKLYGQWSPKNEFVLTLGNNNINQVSKTSGSPKVLDAYTTFNWKKSLSFGMGKNAWTGLSRYAAPSTSSGLGVDIQFIATPLINNSDDLLRKLSFFLKGQKGKLDYRFVLAKPYAPTKPSTFTDVAKVAYKASDYQISTYVKFQLRDKESQKSPFSAATYLGKKDLLTFGAGAFYQPEATMSLFETDSLFHTACSFAVDLFYEHPVYKKTTLTIYAAYYNHDLGPNFIRQVGANNPARTFTASEYMNGKGNSALVTGTGHIYFLQSAIMTNIESCTFQFFGSCSRASLQAVGKRLIHWETGVHYLMDSHRSKLTLGYQNWPLVKKMGDISYIQNRRSSVILQYQFKIG